MNMEGWPDIGTLVFGPGERTREFIVRILERHHYGPTSVRPTEQTLGPQVYTDAGKSTFRTLPFQLGRLKLPGKTQMMMTSMSMMGPFMGSGEGTERLSHLRRRAGGTFSVGSTTTGARGKGALYDNDDDNEDGGSITSLRKGALYNDNDNDDEDGGVVRSAVSVARIGSDFDVVHLCLGLLLSSDTVLSGVMKSTPRAIRDVYFGEDGQVFRTRLGGYLLGGVNFARLPGAVIVASERLCLREAYASAGLEPRGLGL